MQQPWELGYVPSVPRFSVRLCRVLQGPHGQALLCFCRLTDKAVKEYSAYRSSLLFWALVDLIYTMFKVRSSESCGRVCP